MKTTTFEQTVQTLFKGNTYLKSNTDTERGYPALLRDVLVCVRTRFDGKLADSQLEVRLKTENIIGGEQETMTVTLTFQGGRTLAVLLFFVSTKENQEELRVNDVWVTAHEESLEEEILRKAEERRKAAEALLAQPAAPLAPETDETEAV